MKSILIIFSFIFSACSNNVSSTENTVETHQDNRTERDSTVASSTENTVETHHENIHKTPNKYTKYIRIYVTQLLPQAEPYNLVSFLLISDDPLFESLIDKKDDKFYENLFYKNWHTDKDWLVNAVLFHEYKINAYFMAGYEPNMVNDWRRLQKDGDSLFWDSYFLKKRAKQNK